MQKKINLFIVFLVVSSISIGINCKAIKNIFSSDDEEWTKWAKNVKIVYERTLPYESTDHNDASVQANITQVGDSIEGWAGFSAKYMDKVDERRIKLIAAEIPAEKTLYAWSSDFGKDMPWPNNQFGGRKIIINAWNF